MLCLSLVTVVFFVVKYQMIEFNLKFIDNCDFPITVR